MTLYKILSWNDPESREKICGLSFKEASSFFYENEKNWKHIEIWDHSGKNLMLKKKNFKPNKSKHKNDYLDVLSDLTNDVHNCTVRFEGDEY